MQKYKVKIMDMSQPMLVSLRKKRDARSEQDSLIYLVPELCSMTGLSEQMRKNFSLMRDLAECTRLVPSQRMERLQHFNRRLKTNSMVSYCNVWNNVLHWKVDIF
jgi:aubergine-like protein